MKFLLLLVGIMLAGCSGGNGTTVIPNKLTPEQVQAEIDANQAIEAPANSGGGGV